MKIFTKIIAVVFCAVLAAVCGFAVYFFTVTANTALEEDKFVPSAFAATVYDREGTEIASIGFSGKHRCVRFADIPQHVKNAFICAEDKNFYNHNGLDYPGMARAVFKNLKARSFKQGASTISQQLVKNTQLSAEKTLRRKLKEIKLTRQLERKYSKDEIFEMYLNTIYFGHTCYGITDASFFYFDTSPEHLSTAQGAVLAAVIRSPNRYSPFINPQKCTSVRNSILRQMESLGKISSDERTIAEREPMPVQKQQTPNGNCYTDAVRNELRTLPLGALYRAQGGLRIYTYLDKNLQHFIENLKTSADRSGKSILVSDNDSRGIRAYFSTEGTLRRQPGSAIKPLAVYAPALEENLISPCTPVLDAPTSFGNYTPSDYHQHYRGWTSVRDALAYSLNVPAVTVLNQLGINKSKHYLNRTGIFLHENDCNLALALGGMTEGVTLRELVGAYTTFADNGRYIPCAFIRKIEYPDGQTLYERKPSAIRAYSEDTVSLMNTMLRKTVTDGTAAKLNKLPFQIYAKTGTAGSKEGNTDAWTVAYTSRNTVGVWMGNADRTRTDITGGGLPCHYAADVFRVLGTNNVPPPIPTAHSVVECTLDLESYRNDHILRLASSNQPTELTFKELFRSCNRPIEVSPIFDTPSCTARIEYISGTVRIFPNNTDRYHFLIHRTENGRTKELFDGMIDEFYTDRTVRPDRIYSYTIQPYYIGKDKKKVFGIISELPSVHTEEKRIKPPDHWWNPGRFFPNNTSNP